MWDLFDFDNDGKVSLEEEVLGVALLDEMLAPKDIVADDNTFETDENTEDLSDGYSDNDDFYQELFQ